MSGHKSSTQIKDLQDFILEKKIATNEDVNGLVAKEKTMSYFFFLNKKNP
jgi:hypothetical protein